MSMSPATIHCYEHESVFSRSMLAFVEMPQDDDSFSPFATGVTADHYAYSMHNTIWSSVIAVLHSTHRMTDQQR